MALEGKEFEETFGMTALCRGITSFRTRSCFVPICISPFFSPFTIRFIAWVSNVIGYCSRTR
jgi:hypothetical protein